MLSGRRPYSALGDKATADRAIAAGANGYVVKGIEFSELQVRLWPYLGAA